MSEEGVRTCRCCGAIVARTFVDLGVMPLANSYLTAGQLQVDEPRYPLHARVCDQCLLVQIEAVVPAERIFSDYAYFSSYSTTWVEHARRFADVTTVKLGLNAESLVVELASNDGYLLQHFVAAGVPVLGMEPAANVAAAAIEKGIRTDTAFFGLETAQRLVSEGFEADLIVANNVFAHVPDPGLRRRHVPHILSQKALSRSSSLVAPPDLGGAVRHHLPRALLLFLALHC